MAGLSPSSAELQLAGEHARAGRMSEAERVCRDALRTEPRDPNLLHLLGMICCDTGREAEALELIGFLARR